MSEYKQIINIDNLFFCFISVKNNILNVYGLYVFFIDYIMQLTVCYKYFKYYNLFTYSATRIPLV